MEKVQVLEDNCHNHKENHGGLNCYQSIATVLYCRLRMNQQSPEHQLINRLNNSYVKFYLCIYIIISFQICTLKNTTFGTCIVQTVS